jgi:hypothetical protein
MRSTGIPCDVMVAMTLIVAMKAIDAIILAADSRGTIGDPRGLTAVNDTQQKLFHLGKCGMAVAGASEMALALLDEFRKKGIDNVTNIDDTISRVIKEAADLFTQWFHDIAPDKRPGVFLLLGPAALPEMSTSSSSPIEVPPRSGVPIPAARTSEPSHDSIRFSPMAICGAVSDCPDTSTETVWFY